MFGFISVTKDRKKAEAIKEAAELILNRIEGTDHARYASLIIKDHYEVIRDLMSVILLLDGIAVQGESSHKLVIDYVRDREIITPDDARFVHELRLLRHKVTYDGFVVDAAYLLRNKERIENIVAILRKEIQRQL